MEKVMIIGGMLWVILKAHKNDLQNAPGGSLT